MTACTGRDATGTGDVDAGQLGRVRFSWFALSLINAVCVPINSAYSGDMLPYVTCDVESRLVITTAAQAAHFADLALGQRGLLETIVICGAHENVAGMKSIEWDALMIEDGATATIPSNPTDTAFICYTSSTIGPSKGVILMKHRAHDSALRLVA